MHEARLARLVYEVGHQEIPTMRTNHKASLFALALVIPLSGAWSVATELLVLQPQSRLWIDGTSTMKRWTCKAGEVNAVVEANAPNAIATLLAGDKGVRTVRVSVPAAQIDCNNGTMNEHMRKALKLTEHPSIEFRLTSYDVARKADGVAGTMTGSLTLGGVEKTITMKAEGTSEGDMLHVIGAYPLNMKEYGLKPPTLMFGRIKVGETVTVNFDLLLKS
jgi:polyisoprenoid-binding protein YceI